MPTSVPTSEPPSTTVGNDLPRGTCGYNLRTLAWAGRCPECGRPVRDSIPPPDLRFASYRAIRRTRRKGITVAHYVTANLSGLLGLVYMTKRLKTHSQPNLHLIMWLGFLVLTLFCIMDLLVITLFIGATGAKIPPILPCTPPSAYESPELCGTILVLLR